MKESSLGPTSSPRRVRAIPSAPPAAAPASWGSTVDDESAPLSGAPIVPNSPTSRASLLAAPTVTPASERSPATAEHSAPGEHMVARGRRQATVTAAPLLLDKGPSRMGGFTKPTDFAITNPGRGSLHQESFKMRKPNYPGTTAKETIRGQRTCWSGRLRGMTRLVTPLPGSGTTTRGTAADAAGQKPMRRSGPRWRYRPPPRGGYRQCLLP